MADIFDIEDFKPHISGDAKCLSCGHAWVIVAPVGTTEFECPECETMKGVSVGMTCPEVVRQCECGNHHFYVEPNNIVMCSRCGIQQDVSED